MFFFFSSRRRHTRSLRDWSSDVCSSDLTRERVEVKGTVNGRQLRAIAAPDGKGGHYIQLSRELLDVFGAGAGQRVKVVLERIEQEAPVEAPGDLANALAHHVPAKSGRVNLPRPARRSWVA